MGTTEAKDVRQITLNCNKREKRQNEKKTTSSQTNHISEKFLLTSRAESRKKKQRKFELMFVNSVQTFWALIRKTVGGGEIEMRMKKNKNHSHPYLSEQLLSTLSVE